MPPFLLEVYHSTDTSGCNCGKYPRDKFRSRLCQFWHRNRDTGGYERCDEDPELLAHVHDESQTCFYYVESCYRCNNQRSRTKMRVERRHLTKFRCSCGRARRPSLQSVSAMSAIVPHQREGARFKARRPSDELPEPSMAVQPRRLADETADVDRLVRLLLSTSLGSY